MRTFTCRTCGETWETEAHGRFYFCDQCKEKAALARRTKKCAYRHCQETFIDTSPKNGQQFCQDKDCSRRENAFRLGKAQDESFFRAPKDPTRGRCITCHEEYIHKPGDKAMRCPACREKVRHKICKCGEEYVDNSRKNSRRYCQNCRKAAVRRATRSKGTSGVSLARLAPYTNSWWGRVGEELYLRLFPDASDSVAEYGGLSPFDVQHRLHGRVNVKTTCASTSRHGLPRWSFQVGGVKENCDHAFLIGFSADRRKVEYCWLIPALALNDSVCVLSPASQEYAWAEFALPEASLGILNHELVSILRLAEHRSKNPLPPKVKVRRPDEYERAILGRVGEALYQKWYPSSRHLAGENPTALHDFVDADGTLVNVKLRRLAERGAHHRWTFFRNSGSNEGEHFFIGLNRSADMIEAVYRMPTSAILPHYGFSVNATGSKTWDKYKVLGLGLPRRVAELVQLDDLQKTHVELAGLTRKLVLGMTAGEIDLLLQRAFTFHRSLGFPYPENPPDEYLVADLERLQKYQPEGRVLPRSHLGLGLCASYLPHIYDARNAGSDFSARGAFNDDVRFKRALRWALERDAPDLSRSGIRRSLTALNRSPSNFRPAAAFALTRAHCPSNGLVFDPCAGWGGRLMGVLAAGCRYHGVELSEKTVNGLYSLGMRLCENLRVSRDRVALVHGDICTQNTRGIGADFALTSPPFWGREVYPEQQEPLEEKPFSWQEGFLRSLFQRTFEALRPGAVFAVHIADVHERDVLVPLERMAREEAARVGFSEDGSWTMQRSSFGRTVGVRSDPIYLFRK